MKNLRSRYNMMYVNSYNKAANAMNNGGTDKFNKQQERKYGKNYTNRESYETDRMRAFDKKLAEAFYQSLNDFYTTNKHSQKAQELVKKYRMEKWDELAKENSEKIAAVRRAVKGK